MRIRMTRGILQQRSSHLGFMVAMRTALMKVAPGM